MIYKFDDTPITDFGAIPSPANGQFAISGILDMPKRVGTTEHNWGASIEPFVDAEDIELDGRTINLQVAIKKNQLQYFLDACIDCKELEVFDDTMEGRNLLSSNPSRWVFGSPYAYINVGEPGELITISMEDINPEADIRAIYFGPTNTGYTSSGVQWIIQASDKVASRYPVFTIARPYVSFYRYGNHANDLPALFKRFNVKVEKGSTATPWTPAPEDIFFPHPVLCRDEIKVREVNDYCIVSVPFWQDEVIYNPVTIRPSNTGEIRIDGYDLAKDFDVYVAQSNDLDSVAKRIEVQTTEIYKRTNFRASRTIDIACTMKAINTTDLFYKMNEFQAMLMMPGVREFKIRNKDYFVYFKDGMSVEIVAKNIARFNLKATVV